MIEKINNYIERFLTPINNKCDYTYKNKNSLTSKCPIVPYKKDVNMRDTEKTEYGIRRIYIERMSIEQERNIRDNIINI